MLGIIVHNLGGRADYSPMHITEDILFRSPYSTVRSLLYWCSTGNYSETILGWNTVQWDTSSLSQCTVYSKWFYQPGLNLQMMAQRHGLSATTFSTMGRPLLGSLTDCFRPTDSTALYTSEDRISDVLGPGSMRDLRNHPTANSSVAPYRVSCCVSTMEYVYTMRAQRKRLQSSLAITEHP